jgi:hypothetical protein
MFLTDALNKVSLKYKMLIHNLLPLHDVKPGMRVVDTVLVLEVKHTYCSFDGNKDS